MRTAKIVPSVVLTLLIFLFGTHLLAQSDFVGSEVCKGCHDNATWDYKYTHWKGTLHSRSLRDPDLSPGVVTGDFQSGLDLATDADFSPYGINAPVLSYDATDAADSTDGTSGYRVTIGQITYTVHRTYGGNGYWKQRYLTRVGDSFYILPIQYNEKTEDWVAYHPGDWYDANGEPLYDDPATLAEEIEKKDSFERRCAGCHNTGLKVFYHEASGEYTSAYSELNIGCEKCHGPGGPASHANYGLPGQGLNPADLGTDRANEVCGQCHARGKSTVSMGGNTFGYPWGAPDSTGGFLPGDSLEAFYDYVDPVNDPGHFWPDGQTSRSHHQQFLDFYQSPMATRHQVRCFDCHDPHGTANEHDIVESIEVDGLVIATENDNNTLCLACHAGRGPFAALTKEMIADYEANLDSIAAAVSAHTGHPYDPENKDETGGASRCSKCHMPKVAKSAVEYDIHAHTFEAIRPQKTIDYGMPNSCAVSCHRNPQYANIPDFGIVDATLTDWTEDTDVALADTLMKLTGVDEGDDVGSLRPNTYSLSQNYPNPFNPTTDIRYQIGDSRSPIHTTLKIFNLLGQEVRTLVDEPKESGYYTVTWDGGNERGDEVSSGIYFYRLTAGEFAFTKKMALIR